MNRLTRTAEEFDYCRDFCAAKCAYTEGQIHEKCLDASLYEKLRDYEDAETEGRLVVLPCKVGDTVYRIQYIDQNEIGVTRFVVGIAETKFRLLLLDEYGKTVFLTREEAEAARKEADDA